MKRPLCLILAPLLLAALLCACASPSEVQDYPPVDGLTATVVEASPEGLTVLFENDTRVEYYYGQAYTPERRLRGGAWTPIDLRKGVMPIYDSILYIIPPGGSSEMTYKWSSGYGDFPEGEYRLLVRLSYAGDRSTEDAAELVLSIPFSLPFTPPSPPARP